MGNMLDRTRQTIEYSADRVSNVRVNIGATGDEMKIFIYALSFLFVMLGLYFLVTYGWTMLVFVSNWMLFWPSVCFWIWARIEFNKHFCSYCDKYMGVGCPKMRELKGYEGIASKIFYVLGPAYVVRHICFPESVGGFFVTCAILALLACIILRKKVHRRRQDQDYY